MNQFWEIPSKDGDSSRKAKLAELAALQKRAGVVGWNVWDSSDPAEIGIELQRLRTMIAEQASQPSNPLTTPTYPREPVTPKPKRDLTEPKWDMPPKRETRS